MGKQRRKFETGFKQQIVSEVESGLLSVSAASRKYQLSASVIDRWRRQARQGGIESKPSIREKALERENREIKEKLVPRSVAEGKDGKPNPTSRCLFPEAPPPGSIPACSEAGILGALTGVVGAMMALEVIREITGFGESLVGRILLMDTRAMRFETMNYAWDPANPLNGDPGATA